MTLTDALKQIQPADDAARICARDRQNDMAKPLGSLGLLEDALVQLAGAQRTADVRLDKRCVVVFCADNGVVAQGVTQCGQEVTAVVAENLSRGDTTVCIMAQHAHVDVLPIDIGIAREVVGAKIVRRRIMSGTHDMTTQPAMSRTQAIAAIEVGIALAEDCQLQGYHVLATGEMGIGNTTTSSAVAAVLLGVPPETVTGRGAGLTSEGLTRKISAIERALALHKPCTEDIIGVLAAVGGLDIAGMVGLYLGGALCGIPVVMDGFISGVAALAAIRLCPAMRGYLLASHVSAEPAGRLILDALQAKPLICAEMRLGEGTGAIAAIALLDLSLAVYNRMIRFDESKIVRYEPLT